MDSEDIYANVPSRDIQDSTGPQTQNHNQDEEKARKHRGSRCVLVLLVILGLICALLLLFITLQHISITAERDLFKTYKNTVEELNHTISSLQHDNTDLETDKQQLEDKYNSLSLEKLELENNITSLSAELMKARSKPGWFFMSTEAMSWSESRQFCRNHGADLVIIKSEEKQRFISSFVKERVWIGLSDIQTEGTMKWVDNSILNNQGFWLKGEPNDQDGIEDCIELISTEPALNNWNDLPCSKNRKGICEK
ncbi:P-selectin-like [Danio rerio]|uniref:P-selectin-like n=1 Tax=Danio rerio TaxID=7955 RepID=A0AC58G175_DANRE